MSTRPFLSSPALREPNDPEWGRCPHCKQSAQTRINGLLFCYRCNWSEPKAKSSRTTVPTK